MPPLEATQRIPNTLQLVRVTRSVTKGKPLKLALWDISRAHLYGDAQQDLYVELPPEGAQLETDTDSEPMCGLLLRMYGTQD
eukprot:256332-Amphidinium_carterae.1